MSEGAQEPRTIGRIRIEGSLGKGGMGEVFVGFDEKLERRVALKAIRDERRLDLEARARFLREARALSRLDHPGICRLYDYFEDEHADYLVLELLEGETLDEVLRQDELTPDFKLYVAEMIADALSAAHAQGIAHRDLKPENVMLTGNGEVKLLDFGLASTAPLPTVDEPGIRASEPGLPEAEISETEISETEISETVEPESGDPESGDPESTTPTVVDTTAEQGRVDGIEASATMPGGAGRATALLSRLPWHGGPRVTELPSDEPDPLLTEEGAILGTVAYMSPEQARGERITPASDLYSFGLLLQELFTGRPAHPRDASVVQLLLRAARGETSPIEGLGPELTELVVSLLAIAPEDRPPAARVVERLRAIEDRPRQRRRRILLAVVVAMLLFAGLKYTWDLRRERSAAQAARLEAEQVSDLMVGLFAVSDPGLGRDVTARELLDAGAEQISRELSGQPRAQSRLLATIGRIYRQLGLYDRAQPLLEEALAIRRRLYGDDHPEIVSSLDHLASLYHDQGDYGRAEPLFLRSLEIRQGTLGEEHPHVAASLNNLAFLYQARGELERAEPLFHRSLGINRRIHGEAHPDVARALNNLGELERLRGRGEEAASLLRRALEIQRQVLGRRHPEVAITLNNLAIVLHQSGRHREAERLYRQMLVLTEESLGSEHPNIATVLNNLAELQRSLGAYADAEPLYRRAIEIQEKALGEEHPGLAVTLSNLADLHAERGEWQAAETLYRRAVGVQEKSLGPLDPSLAVTLDHLAGLEAARGRFAAAEALYRRAGEIQSQTLDTEHPSRIATAIGHADLLLRQGKTGRAAELLEPLAGWRASSSDVRAERREARYLLVRGKLEAARGREELARQSWSAGLDLLVGEPGVVDTLSRRHLRALLLLHLGRVAEGRREARELAALGWHDDDLFTLADL